MRARFDETLRRRGQLRPESRVGRPQPCADVGLRSRCVEVGHRAARSEASQLLLAKAARAEEKRIGAPAPLRPSHARQNGQSITAPTNSLIRRAELLRSELQQL